MTSDVDERIICLNSSLPICHISIVRMGSSFESTLFGCIHFVVETVSHRNTNVVSKSCAVRVGGTMSLKNPKISLARKKSRGTCSILAESRAEITRSCNADSTSTSPPCQSSMACPFSFNRPRISISWRLAYSISSGNLALCLADSSSADRDSNSCTCSSLGTTTTSLFSTCCCCSFLGKMLRNNKWRDLFDVSSTVRIMDSQQQKHCKPKNNRNHT
mmetsp:Transcript_27286/g.49324  ORF Transcript_27286/g.49324 Transcript_27286/m.49324 type:complete len:217 (+) Transcript_27286:183-833(+)